MPITTRDALVAAMAGFGSFTGTFSKTAVSANTFRSQWLSVGYLPAAGTAPGPAATCSAATAGSLPMPTVATTGNTLYLTGLSVYTISSLSVWALYDRVAHMSGLSGAVTTSQTVNLTAGARITSTVGVQMYIETYAANGGQPIWTASYTNSAGVAGRTATCGYGSQSTLGAFFAFTLQSGDVGVASVQSVTQTGGAGTGNYGITLARSVAQLPIGQQFPHRNHTTLTDLSASPCLFLTCIGQGSTIYGSYSVAEG